MVYPFLFISAANKSAKEVFFSTSYNDKGKLKQFQQALMDVTFEGAAVSKFRGGRKSTAKIRGGE